MGTQTKHPAGNFCWFELGTTDQDAAKAFYQTLFGWEASDSPLPPEMGGVYTTFLCAGKEVGACYLLGPEMKGAPPHWMPYVAVDAADAMAARVTELGGTLAMPPFDVMTYGRMVMFTDPTGANLSLWQPHEHLGVDLAGAPGSVCWGELGTKDTAAAKAFYTALFGWTMKEAPDDSYTEWVNGEQAIGGMLAHKGPEFEHVPAHWLIYFNVADADATVAQAVAAGATTCVPPTNIPGTGRFAVLADPQGAMFAVIKLDMPG